MPDLVSLDGGRGTGVEFYGTAYPFVRPSADVVGILADFWLAHENRALKGPFHIAELRNFGRTLGTQALGPEDEHMCDVVVRDADDELVCDTSAASYEGRAFGNRFYVHQWAFPDMIVRAVQHTKRRQELVDAVRLTEDDEDRITEDEEFVRILEQPLNPIPPQLEPENGILDERTNELLAERVLTLQVGAQKLSGNVRLQAGFNIELTTADPTAFLAAPSVIAGLLAPPIIGPPVLETSLQISAIAGAGAGSLSNCGGAEEGIRSINLVKPTTDGRFVLAAKDCIYVMPTLENAAASLQLGNQCGACCSCQKYVDTYKELVKVYDRLRGTDDRGVELQNEYIDMVEIVDQIIECAKARPLSIAAVGGAVQNTDAAQTWTTAITVAVSICNTTDACLTNVEAAIAITFPALVAPSVSTMTAIKTLDNGQTIPEVPAGLWPNYTISWPTIAPGRTVRAQFSLIWYGRVTLDGPPPTGTFEACVTATADGESLPIGGDPYTACTTVDVSL